MGRRVLEVSPHFLVDFCRAPGEMGRRVSVDEALPEDTRFISAHVGDDAQTVLLILDSAGWAERPPSERLLRVRPRFTVHVEAPCEEPPEVPRITP